MSSVTLRLPSHKPGSPLVVTVPCAVAGPCRYCGVVGRVRCGVCLVWYCTAHCQACHWAVHRRDCIQPPALVWPNGSAYTGEEVVEQMLEEEGEKDMTSMSMLIPVGTARLEQKMIGNIDTKKETIIRGSEVFAVLNKPKASLPSKKEIATAKKEKDLFGEGSVATPFKKTSISLVEKNASVASADTEAATTTVEKNRVTCESMEAEAAPQAKKDVATLPIKKEAAAPLPEMQLAAPQAKNEAISPPAMKEYAAPAAKKETAALLAEEETANLPAKKKTSVSSVIKEVASAPAKKGAAASVKKEIVVSANVVAPSIEKIVSSAKKVDAFQTEANFLSGRPSSHNIQAAFPTVSIVREVEGKIPNKTCKAPNALETVNVAPDASFKSYSAEYSPAIASTTLTVQSPPHSLTKIVVPVDDITSPGQFGIRLVEQEVKLNSLLENMNVSPPPTVQGWKFGKGETVAVVEQDIWYRGLAVNKKEGKFQVYLLDYGGLVTVKPDQIRPLPNDWSGMPAANYQVCLAGLGPMVGEAWGEHEGKLLAEILNSSVEYKLGVEFVGQVEGGRWIVKIRGMEDNEDIGQLLLEGNLAKVKEDVLVKRVVSLDNSLTVAKHNQSKGTIAPKFTPDLSLSISAMAPSSSSSPSVLRGVLAPGSNAMALVCYLETPAVFFICLTTSVDMFTSILTLTQDCPPGHVLPALGNCCIAIDEDCWYRAEIVKLSQDLTIATLFLLDYGKTITSSMTSLRPLPEELVQTPGLVCRVGLHGIEPLGKEWSEEEIGGAEIVMDVGKDVTQFTVQMLELDSKGDVLISMTDMEGTDVASLMVESGIVAPADLFEYKDVTQELFQAGSLALGTQTVMVLSAVSPMELSFCTQEMFMQLSTCISMTEKVAASSTSVIIIKPGDPILACDEGTWYRAKVIDVMDDEMVYVELVDLASNFTTLKGNLRKISPELMKQTVVAVSCCLDSWVGEDKKRAMDKWGKKMAEMVEQYSEVQVEVVGQLENGQFKVKFSELEKKLKEMEVKSRAEMFKDRLRKN